MPSAESRNGWIAKLGSCIASAGTYVLGADVFQALVVLLDPLAFLEEDQPLFLAVAGLAVPFALVAQRLPSSSPARLVPAAAGAALLGALLAVATGLAAYFALGAPVALAPRAAPLFVGAGAACCAYVVVSRRTRGWRTSLAFVVTLLAIAAVTNKVSLRVQAAARAAGSER